jgi:ubiquitin C-terminal hydrolase
MIHVSLNDLRRDQDVCSACNSKNYDMFATLNYASTLAKCQIPEEEIRNLHRYICLQKLRIEVLDENKSWACSECRKQLRLS